jgi:hypothetical protein
MDVNLRKQKKMKNRKGIFFTLAIILILVPLLLLVSYYITMPQTKMEDTNSKIRCDELHYFVEDVKKDLSRAGTIFGRRAAIYAIDYAMTAPGNPLFNYSFDCNPSCSVDCEKVVYPRNGSEAAIAELALCGTLNGTNVTYMINHTIKEWVRKMEMRSLEKNFKINMTIKEVRVVATDPFNFSIIVDNQVGITDDTSICYYMGTDFKTMSNTSIIGLEDPLYSFSTGGLMIKYFSDCDPTTDLSKVIAGGNAGGGLVNGHPILYSDPRIGGTQTGLEDFCTNSSADALEQLILVMNQGPNPACSSVISDATNISSAKHFRGIITEAGNRISCAYTIPWINISSTLALNESNCIYLRNNGSTHEIVNGTNCENLNYTCYLPSNATDYCGGCAGQCFDGPSFFDRLDGRHNLSEIYKNQSVENFNNPVIGLETFVDAAEIVGHGLAPYWNASRIDYLYWQNISGNGTCGLCSGWNPSFKLDCAHAKKYGLETGC